MDIMVMVVVIVLAVLGVFVYGVYCGWRLRDGFSDDTDQQIEARMNGLWNSLELTRAAWETERQMWAEALRQLDQGPDQRP
jgi:hypothetical protein